MSAGHDSDIAKFTFAKKERKQTTNNERQVWSMTLWWMI